MSRLDRQDAGRFIRENTLQMEWCIACHRAPEKFIRPKSQIFNMEWQDGDLDAAERDKLKVDLKIRSKEMMTYFALDLSPVGA